MRLPRPRVPLAVRLKVAERQVTAMHGGRRPMFSAEQSAERRLLICLDVLFAGEPCHLDHDPPLAARPYDPSVESVAARYTPNANDPDHLFYRAVVDHKVKTNVRGEHGQYPDRVLIKRERRRQRKPRRKAKIAGRSSLSPCRLGAACRCDRRRRRRCENWRKVKIPNRRRTK